MCTPSSPSHSICILILCPWTAAKAYLRRDSSWEYKCVRRRRRSSHLTHSASPLCIRVLE